MEINTIIDHLTKFMLMPQDELISKFSGLPGAIQLPYANDNPIVFVPGRRKSNRVCLIAHYDTVFHHSNTWDQVKVDQYGPILFNHSSKSAGIGADDRSGCALLWSLRNSGHSLLLLPDEEIGCKGSRHLVDQYPDVLKNHAFLMQFDRRGSKDLVYYSNYHEGLHKFMCRYFYDYSRAYGSNTDVAVLARESLIAGVNVSIGYSNEHTKDEVQDVFDYMRTGWYAKILLKEKIIPDFRLEKPKPYVYQYPTKGDTPKGKAIQRPYEWDSVQRKYVATRKGSNSSATTSVKTSTNTTLASRADQIKDRVEGRQKEPITSDMQQLCIASEMTWYCPTCKVYPDEHHLIDLDDERIHKECGTECRVY